MFIATKRTSNHLAPLGAKPGQRNLYRGRHLLRSYGASEGEKGPHQAINISPPWGEATTNVSLIHDTLGAE
jgi:hypothetical protein